MACTPEARVAMVNVAVPLFRETGWPNGLAPSNKVMVPPGVNEVPGVLEETVAVKVTAWPERTELTGPVNVVWVAPGFTTWVRTEEVLALKLASPLYAAVIPCVPAATAPEFRVAVPLIKGAVPNGVPSERNVTVPVGLPCPVVR